MVVDKGRGVAKTEAPELTACSLVAADLVLAFFPAIVDSRLDSDAYGIEFGRRCSLAFDAGRAHGDDGSRFHEAAHSAKASKARQDGGEGCWRRMRDLWH